MSTIFFTGFPGFLGSELLPRLLRRSSDAAAVCLVQPKYAPMARDRAEALARRHPWLEGRVRLVEGDITKPRLGIHDARAQADEVAEIFHLAAVYNLSVPKDLAHRINVLGTRHVLDFARITDQSRQQPCELPLVLLHQQIEGPSVTALCAFDQLLVDLTLRHGTWAPRPPCLCATDSSLCK